MKVQKAKFRVGDIVVNIRNQWRRLIRDIGYAERSGMIKVMYFYSTEEFNEHYYPTGRFHYYSHVCGQDHLLTWQKGGK